MYTGKNPTAIQSQKMLCDALLSFMEQKEFQKINVKELCEAALVSRQTFYTLFQTKEQILEWHFDQLFADYIAALDLPKTTSIGDICYSSILYLTGEKHFIRLLVQNNLGYILTRKIEQYLLELKDYFHPKEQLYEEYAIAFLAGALTEMISRYMKNGATVQPEILCALTEQILTGQHFKL